MVIRAGFDFMPARYGQRVLIYAVYQLRVEVERTHAYSAFYTNAGLLSSR